jgi:hydroxysqualene synthase
MSGAAELRSSKGHRDENFPVASLLIKAEHHRPILAFCDFVRTADDIADHPTLEADKKRAPLDALEAGLLGQGGGAAAAQRLRAALAERQLTARHARDLLAAFRMDVTKRRYRNWELPVGRFTLDVHGEPEATWPANDALCVLPINNQLQDCHADDAKLERVYVPVGALAEAGATIEDHGAPRSSPALRRCRRALSTAALLQQSNGSAGLIGDFRRSLEVAAITAMAWQILGLIKTRDPLSENVHLTKFGAMRSAVAGMAAGSLARLVRGGFASRKSGNA